MNKKIPTFFLIALFLISFVTSTSLGTGKQNEEITLYQMCSNCSYVNLTSITYPNKTTINYGILMNKTGEDYTYPFSSTSQFGEYQYNVCGDKDGGYKCEIISFLITPSGSSQSTSQGIGSLGYLFLMVILMFVFGYIGFKFFKTEDWWILGIFFEFFAAVFLIYNTWLGYQYHKYVTGLPTSAIPETFFWMILFIIVAGGLTSIALLFRHWKKIFRYMKREIKRKEGYEDVEDWDVDNWAGEKWDLKR